VRWGVAGIRERSKTTGRRKKRGKNPEQTRRRGGLEGDKLVKKGMVGETKGGWGPEKPSDDDEEGDQQVAGPIRGRGKGAVVENAARGEQSHTASKREKQRKPGSP